MILGTSVGRAVEADAVSVVAGVNTIVVGSMTMVVGSQSAVLVNVAVGRMLVTGSAFVVGVGEAVTTGAEVFETVTNVEAFEPDAESLVAVALTLTADVLGVDDWVAGAEVSVELPTEPVSIAEEDETVPEPVTEPVTETVGEVMEPVGSELVLLLTGVSVTEAVGPLEEVPEGGLVMVAEPVAGGSLLVELMTVTSELVELGAEVTETGRVGIEMLIPEEVDDAPEEVVLAPSEVELAGADDEVSVGITGGSVKGREMLGRPLEDVEDPVPGSDDWTGRPEEVS
jgi:hypothetical protein